MAREDRDKIDFVITWVDGSDPAWRKEFDIWNGRQTACAPPGGAVDNSGERYRDWDLLRYWFRGVEKFAPWVNRVHFVTWGHIPGWLDVSNPKLNVVNHRDFIPGQYLPTFSSCPIELNIHRIEGLADRFVYFNDDMFLLRPVLPGRFFSKGLPCDLARLSVIQGRQTSHNMLECVNVINRRYSKREVIRRNAGKWFSPKYSLQDRFKTLTLLPWSFFPGFREHHMPQPFLKGTFEKLWEEEPGVLSDTSEHRFRQLTDVSQWLMHYEQLASGMFRPHGYRDTALRRVSEDNADGIAREIKSGRYSMICINDNNNLSDIAQAQGKIGTAFMELLPDPSSFEKK